MLLWAVDMSSNDTLDRVDAGPYKDTVNLPQTKFNMRANSKQREPELQRFWEEQNIYEQLLQTNSGVCSNHTSCECVSKKKWGVGR